MGRLNIDYIKYILKNKLIKIIPYKYRKPFILVFAVLSLYGYFKFMIMLSARLFGTPSTYLLIMQNAVMSVLDILVRSFGQNGAAAVMALLTCILIYRYTRPVYKKNENKNEWHSKSLYYEINAVISLLYVVITVLAFIPLFIK